MIDPLVLFRAVHIAATVLACGSAVFIVLIAEPAFHAKHSPTDDLPGLRHQVNVIIWCALIVSVLAAAGWLVWLSAGIYGAPVITVSLHGGVWTVLADTRFGQVTIARVALAAIFAALMMWPAGRLSQIVVAAGLIGLLAFVGHAGATPGTAGTVHLVSDMVHLCAAAGWLGALPGLVIVLGRARRDPAWKTIATETTQRFSRLGVLCVVSLLATGIINSWSLLGGPRDLITTTYGELLLIKIGLFLAMVLIAALNRVYLTPRLPAAGALRALQRNSIAETILGLCTLAIVGVLGTLSPSRHAHSATADVPADAAFVHIHTSEAMAEVTLTPGRVGSANAHIRVLRDDFTEYPAKSVEFTLDPPDGTARLARAAAHLPDGTWEVNGVDLPKAGVWTVRVIIPAATGRPLVLDGPVEIAP